MTRPNWTPVGVLALLVAVVPVLGCGDSSAPASPASAAAGLTGANPDGSMLKVTKPSLQSPTNEVRLEDQTPVFRFTNAQGIHVSIPLGHELQLLTHAQQPIYTQAVASGSGQTTHTYPGTLELATPYLWRVRATYQGQFGPWSDTATFVTADRPDVTPETLVAYLHEFAAGAGSVEWSGCAAGSGSSCFRFVWDVVESMNPTCDPNSWGLLSKNPGEWQCTRSGCGSLGGEGFGEDVVTHGGWSPILLWDIVGGAGAPGASLQAAPIPRDDRRAGNNWACPWGN